MEVGGWVHVSMGKSSQYSPILILIFYSSIKGKFNPQTETPFKTTFVTMHYTPAHGVSQESI